MPYIVQFESKLKAETIKEKFHEMLEDPEQELEVGWLKGIISPDEQENAKKKAKEFFSNRDIQSAIDMIQAIIDNQDEKQGLKDNGKFGSKGTLVWGSQQPIFKDLDKEFYMMHMYFKLENLKKSKAQLDTSWSSDDDDDLRPEQPISSSSKNKMGGPY